ncbi:MAG: EVE domain-containing protein [Oligoflexia bacterium]|nr:EVE domain-containing protein [Oligoflexia bacterium]
MNYWILKSEPETYSFQDLIKDKKACWDGVRNYQARNNLRKAAVGDLAIIYHSGDDRAAVGIAKVSRAAYQDAKTKDDWSAIDLVPVKEFKTPVSLAQMKADKVLKVMSLVKQSRLSVCPLNEIEYKRLLVLGF